MIILQQLAVQGSSPGARAGHAAVSVGSKASNFINMYKIERHRTYRHCMKIEQFHLLM